MVTLPAFYFLARRFRGMERQISVPSDYLLLLLFLLANLLFFVLPFSKIVHAFFSIPLNAVSRAVWNSRQARR